MRPGSRNEKRKDPTAMALVRRILASDEEALVAGLDLVEFDEYVHGAVALLVSKRLEERVTQRTA